MSFLSEIEAAFGKAAHDIVVGAEKTKTAIIKVAATLEKDAPALSTAATLAEGVAEELSPGAGAVATAVVAAAGKVFAAVQSAGTAANANGLNLTLDDATITAIKAALPAVAAKVATPAS